MPTYEYKCPVGHVSEKFYPTMNAARHLKCPVCGRRAERIISGGAGLVFKGSGFYITDYKRAGPQQPVPDGETKSESKPGETKPATEKPAEAKPADGAKKKKPDSDK
jgi:putative FmdB family regulatory protein